MTRRRYDEGLLEPRSAPGRHRAPREPGLSGRVLVVAVIAALLLAAWLVL